jgi:glycosyltransferase involved in cell wall biosynthesis
MLDGCLSALTKSVREFDEILVVDSASRSGDVRRIAEKHGVRYLRTEVPGASIARNIGWREAKNDVVAFLDDDVRASAQWAEALSGVFETHAEAAFVTGRVGLLEGQEDSFRPVALIQRPDPIVLRRGLHELTGHSANLAVRRYALTHIGGFDEILGAGARLRAAEDLDLFDRLYGAGYSGRYDTEALAWHDQWRSRGELLRLDYDYGIGAGARIAKLFRTDRVHALKAGKSWFWFGGITLVLNRDDFGGLGAVARLLGGSVGFVRGLSFRVARGHFVRRKAGAK